MSLVFPFLSLVSRVPEMVPGRVHIGIMSLPRLGTLLPYTMDGPFKTSMNFLIRLAWTTKLQLPVLIAVAFMAFDIRLQLEINIFWEGNQRQAHNQVANIERPENGDEENLHGYAYIEEVMDTDSLLGHSDDGDDESSTEYSSEDDNDDEDSIPVKTQSNSADSEIYINMNNSDLIGVDLNSSLDSSSSSHNNIIMSSPSELSSSGLLLNLNHLSSNDHSRGDNHNNEITTEDLPSR